MSGAISRNDTGLAARVLVAEALGTALLVAVVVGSGIMAERLAGGNVALALLANALATGAGLYVLISVFAPISGAEFNPVVTMAGWLRSTHDARGALARIAAQGLGGVAGTALAHAMFGLPLLAASTTARTGAPLWIAEVVATFGLLFTILRLARARSSAIPTAVALYITAAYWFTASTSFANPAVTLARAFTPTFAGIAPADVPMFVLAQIAGALAALLLDGWFAEREPGVAVGPSA